MKKEAYKRIFLESLTLVIGLVLIGLFWRKSILLAVILAVIIAGYLKFTYQKGDIFVYIYGFIAGAIIELSANYFMGFQRFPKPDIFGTPVWLVIAWGYLFVFAKRIGTIISKEWK